MMWIFFYNYNLRYCIVRQTESWNDAAESEIHQSRSGDSDNGNSATLLN
ncbi:MAG: hypothetical protein IPQ11_14615 [Bacteroidetes bacterium]|nr:hypothetical protein [Bacteroidota bacterium]